MTLQIADLLAIAGIIALPVLPFVVAGALALLKSDIRDLRTETRADMQALRTEARADREGLRAEIRAVNAKVESLTQAIRTSALAHHPLATASKSGAPSPTTERNPALGS